MKHVSVIMSIYNEDVITISRSINSILNQTYKDFEIVIVIDNPDNFEATQLVINFSLVNTNLKYIINSKNIGLPASLNKAIRLSEGKYIARQDADDESDINRLRNQMECIEKNGETEVLGCSLAYTDIETNRILFIRKYKENVGSEIKRYNPLAHPTMVIKKENFELYGYYDEINSFLAEDYDLWFRWYNQGVKFKNLDQVLYTYFQSKENKKNRNTKNQLRATIKVKLRYSIPSKFNFVDYLVVFFEMCLLMLPKKWIIFLFYFIREKQG